jgi:hypothetical protein
MRCLRGLFSARTVCKDKKIREYVKKWKDPKKSRKLPLFSFSPVSSPPHQSRGGRDGALDRDRVPQESDKHGRYNDKWIVVEQFIYDRGVWVSANCWCVDINIFTGWCICIFAVSGVENGYYRSIVIYICACIVTNNHAPGWCDFSCTINSVDDIVHYTQYWLV